MCSATPTTVVTVGLMAPTRVWAAGRPLADAVPAGSSIARTAARAAKRTSRQRALSGCVAVVMGVSLSAPGGSRRERRAAVHYSRDVPHQVPDDVPDHVPDRLVGKGVGNLVADHAEAAGKPAGNPRVLPARPSGLVRARLARERAGKTPARVRARRWASRAPARACREGGPDRAVGCSRSVTADRPPGGGPTVWILAGVAVGVRSPSRAGRRGHPLVHWCGGC